MLMNDQNDINESLESEDVRIDLLAGVVHEQFRINEQHRQEEFLRALLDAHHMRGGKYSSGKLAEIRSTGGSEVYAPLAAMQSVAGAAAVTQVVIPDGDRAWSVDSTPLPMLSRDKERDMVKHLRSLSALGKPSTEVQDQEAQIKKTLLKKQNEEAHEAASEMERKIEDQFIESGYYDAIGEFIEDVATYPFAVMKRVTTYQKRLHWSGGKVKVRTIPVDNDVRVSPFDVYPSPGMTGVDDGPFIERLSLRPKELADYRNVRGFRKEEIDTVLDKANTGQMRSWLYGMDDNERYEAEEQSLLSIYGGEIDVLRYFGHVRGDKLQEYNIKVADENEYYDTEIWVIENHVIRVALNQHPLDRRPYYKTVWRKVPGQFAGTSPTLQVKHLEMICNASLRALVNNMAIASGPQIVVFIDQLPKRQEEIPALRPLQVWQMVSRPGQTQPPVTFFQPASNAQELIGVFQHFWELASDVTGIYRWNFGGEKGMEGASSTMQGLSMLLEQSNKVVRHAVRNIENDVVKKRVHDQFVMNMVYGDISDMKGDIEVIVKGASSLTEKASLRQRRNELLMVMNQLPEQEFPGLMQVFAKIRIGLIRDIANDLELNRNAIPTDEEVERILSEMMKSSQESEPDPRIQVAQINAQARVEDQKLEMADHREHRKHQKLIKDIEFKTAIAQQGERMKGDFERQKMDFAAKIAKLNQHKEQIDREFALKEKGLTGI